MAFRESRFISTLAIRVRWGCVANCEWVRLRVGKMQRRAEGQKPADSSNQLWPRGLARRGRSWHRRCVNRCAFGNRAGVNTYSERKHVTYRSDSSLGCWSYLAGVRSEFFELRLLLGERSRQWNTHGQKPLVNCRRHRRDYCGRPRSLPSALALKESAPAGAFPRLGHRIRRGQLCRCFAGLSERAGCVHGR